MDEHGIGRSECVGGAEHAGADELHAALEGLCGGRESVADYGRRCFAAEYDEQYLVLHREC